VVPDVAVAACWMLVVVGEVACGLYSHICIAADDAQARACMSRKDKLRKEMSERVCERRNTI
jgi:hypothetical protein